MCQWSSQNSSRPWFVFCVVHGGVFWGDPNADVKEPVALAPEQVLKPAQRMCQFLALRLAFGNPSASDLHKAALSGSCKTGLFSNENDLKITPFPSQICPWLARVTLLQEIVRPFINTVTITSTIETFLALPCDAETAWPRRGVAGASGEFFAGEGRLLPLCSGRIDYSVQKVQKQQPGRSWTSCRERRANVLRRRKRLRRKTKRPANHRAVPQHFLMKQQDRDAMFLF